MKPIVMPLVGGAAALALLAAAIPPVAHAQTVVDAAVEANALAPDHDGQLNDIENIALEGRPDNVAVQTHWQHDGAFQPPWQGVPKMSSSRP